MDEERRRIRKLVEIYYDVQKTRLQSYNRLLSVGEVKGVSIEYLKKLEREIKKYIQSEVKDVPIYREFLSSVKGIGPVLAGGLIAYFDPYKAEHPSSFWRYAGLHVVDGEAPRRTRGQRVDWNPRARTLCWKIGKALIRSRSPFYSEIYYEAKRKESEKLRHPEEDPRNCPHYEACIKRLKRGRPPCKLHIDMRAMRKMVKRFLLHLWLYLPLLSSIYK
jgi:transposase